MDPLRGSPVGRRAARTRCRSAERPETQSTSGQHGRSSNGPMPGRCHLVAERRAAPVGAKCRHCGTRADTGTIPRTTEGSSSTGPASVRDAIGSQTAFSRVVLPRAREVDSALSRYRRARVQPLTISKTASGALSRSGRLCGAYQDVGKAKARNTSSSTVSVPRGLVSSNFRPCER
jgi:hypothetical protein